MEASKAVQGPEPVTLRAIDAELRDINEALLESGGELTPEIEALLDALQGERDEKIERIAMLYRTMRAHEATAAGEEAHYAGLRKMWAASAERLKTYVHGIMRHGAQPVVRVRTGRVNTWRQRNSRPSFVCADPSSLPDDLRYDPPAPEPRLRDDVALVRWKAEFDRLVAERTGLMGKDERARWVLDNLQALAAEAARTALPPGVTASLDEFLRL